MKTLARVVIWFVALAVAALASAVGLFGVALLPSGIDKAVAGALVGASLLLGAAGMDQIVGIAYDKVKLDVMIDWFRVRNWRRRQAWRGYAAVLAGQSTAASFGDAWRTHAIHRAPGVAS